MVHVWYHRSQSGLFIQIVCSQDKTFADRIQRERQATVKGADTDFVYTTYDTAEEAPERLTKIPGKLAGLYHAILVDGHWYLVGDDDREEARDFPALKDIREEVGVAMTRGAAEGYDFPTATSVYHFEL